MYIKLLNSKNEPVISNFNILDSQLIRVEGNLLIIELKEEGSKSITLKDNEQANKAFEKLFMTLGFSSPLDKTIDFTNLDTPEGMIVDKKSNEDSEEETETKEVIETEKIEKN